MAKATSNRSRLAVSGLTVFCLLCATTLSAQTVVGFSPDIVNLEVGESAIVAVTVSNVPEPGLAAYQLSLGFESGIANILNPNEEYRAAIPAFAPLAENPFCTVVRGSSACPDPEWFLISTGRSPDVVPDTIQNTAGFVQFGFATHGAIDPPSGGGVIGLIRVSAIKNGSVTVNLQDVVLVSAHEPPTPIAISLGELTVDVGSVARRTPIPDSSMKKM